MVLPLLFSRNLSSFRVPFACVLVAAVLVLGCTIIDIDQLEEGSLAPLSFSQNHPPYSHQEIIFSHELHRKLDCSTCHGQSASREEVLAGGLPPMKTCFQCHNGVEKSQACETCHVENRRERKPRFHTAAWTGHHKDMARREAYKCSLCHLESECQQCHSTWKPQSHNLRFLRSTHGRYAIQDRRSCATCHSSDFCENCHRQPPPDHTPTFRAGGHKQVARLKVRACLTCHSFQGNCAPCHSPP